MNMKTKYYMIALAAMTMTLGSCSDSENTTGTEAPKSITVSTSIGKMTRITTDEREHRLSLKETKSACMPGQVVPTMFLLPQNEW